MTIIESTRPSLDVNIDIVARLYPIGVNRWHTALLVTDDPGPNPGQITIYGDLASLAQDYPVWSETYKAADQFFDQEGVDELHVLPILSSNPPGAEPALIDWSTTINNLIASKGLSWYHIAAVRGAEDVAAQFADAANNYEVIVYIKNSAGDRASLVTGSGDTQVTWKAHVEGPEGNNHTIEYVDPGTNSAELALSKSENANGGYDITVSLATNESGTIITTPADIAAAVAADPEISFIVFCEGTGAGAVSAEPKTALSGGGANASTIESFGEVLKTLSSTRVFGMMHDQPNIYHPDVVAMGIATPMNPGSFTFKNRIPQGIPEADYTATERSNQRKANINSIFRNPAGLLNITDDFASDGSFIDVQMAIDVLAHWMRIGIWDLLSQPPAGYNKIPYDNDGFAMIQDRLVAALQRGASPQWNFIASRGGLPCAQVYCPTFQQTSIEDRKNRIYRPWFEATYKGAIHEVDVRGYLTVEFIPPTEQRLGTGLAFDYE